jgi:hypothetical protein
MVIKDIMLFQKSRLIVFSDCQPTDDDYNVSEAEDLIVQAKQAITQLENYHGCGDSIRLALSNSRDDNQQRDSFRSVSSNITTISQFYNISNAVGTANSMPFTDYVYTTEIIPMPLVCL